MLFGMVVMGLLILAIVWSGFAVNDVGDPNSSVVDVFQPNRVIDVDPGDQFWLTVPEGSGVTSVRVYREGDKGWTWVKAGEFLLVQYDQPGAYTIRLHKANGVALPPFTVRVFAPPEDVTDYVAKRPRGGDIVLNAAAPATSFTLGSVYAGLYNDGATNKFPLRIYSSSGGACTVTKYGGGWSNTYELCANCETSDVVNVPAGQIWTMVKSVGGTHTLSTNSPSKLKVVDLILTNDLGHAPVPGSVANQTWYALTNEVVTLQVMPGPAWVTNSPDASASLFLWTKNGVALPITTDLTQTFSPGLETNVVNVWCMSPNTTPTNQVTAIIGLAILSQTYATYPVDRTRKVLGVGEEVDLTVIPSLSETITWSLAGGGSLSTNSGQFVRFTAHINATNSVMSTAIAGTVFTNQYTVLEPVGVASAVISQTFHYAQGACAAGMQLFPIVMAPTNVAFYRVECIEVGMPATAISGYYTNHPPPSHVGHGADIWFGLDQQNRWPANWDVVRGGDLGQPWASGSFTWDIPSMWRVVGSTVSNSLAGWNQVYTLQPDGTLTIEKLGKSVTRTTNDVITTTP
jgi:hypothetical protein